MLYLQESESRCAYGLQLLRQAQEAEGRRLRPEWEAEVAARRAKARAAARRRVVALMLLGIPLVWNCLDAVM